MLNHAKVQFATSHKYLVLISDSRLDFIKHRENKINKFKQIKGMMKRRSLTPSTKFLLTIYNKKYPPLMLNDTKFHFKNYTETFSIDFRFQTSCY